MKNIINISNLYPFALVGVAQGSDITVGNRRWKQVVPQNPQRVIVLDFGAADTLRALGVQDKIVGFPQSGKIQTIFQNLQTKNIRILVI